MSWREVAALKTTGSDTPTAIAFSMDGGTLVSGGQSGGLSFWDVGERRLRRTARGHTKSLGAATYSRGRLAGGFAQRDGTIRLWDAATGGPRGSLTGHVDTVNEVAFFPDGPSLASASEDGSVQIWNLATGKERYVLSLRKPENPVRALSVAIAADGATLAAGGSDGVIRLWETATGRFRKSFPVPARESPETPAQTTKPEAEADLPPVPSNVPAPENADQAKPKSPTTAPAQAPAAPADAPPPPSADGVALDRAEEQEGRGGDCGIDKQHPAASARGRSARQVRQARRGGKRSGAPHNVVLASTDVSKATRTVLLRRIGPARSRTQPDVSPITSLAFAADGSSVASADLAGRVQVWDVESGKWTGVIGTHRGAASMVGTPRTAGPSHRQARTGPW